MGKGGLGRGREKGRGTTEERSQPQEGTFDCTRLALISPSHVGSTGSSHRHINLSGKTGGEGQVFEHLLKEGVHTFEHLLKEGVHTVRVNGV